MTPTAEPGAASRKQKSTMISIAVIVVLALLTVGFVFRDKFRQSSDLAAAVDRVDSVVPTNCAVTSREFKSVLSEPLKRPARPKPRTDLVIDCQPVGPNVGLTMDTELEEFETKLASAGYVKGPNAGERSNRTETLFILIRDSTDSFLIDVRTR